MRPLKFLYLVFLIGFLPLNAQNEVDKVEWQSTIDWIERKMTFNYYDPINEHWWINRIQVNENGTYTVKNIAAKHPSKVLGKKYHNRTFNFYDLNPNTVSIIDLPTGQGRFVKGKIVRAECFKDEKDISVKKDGKVGSKVGFIHISVPQELLDSTESYAAELKTRFAKAAFLDSRLYNTGNLEDNITAVFKSLRGNYSSEDGTSNLKFDLIDIGLVRFELQKDNKLFIGTMGFDVKKKSLYLFLAGNKHYEMRDLTFDTNATDLILKSGDDFLNVIGRNTLEFGLGEIQGKYFRY